MPENPALSKLTHQHYVKDYVSDTVLEANIALNRMKASGKIRYGVGGTQIGEGVARTGQHTIDGWSSLSTQTVSQPNLHENWTAQWGGLIGSYFIQEWDLLANQGKKEALFSMQEQYADSLEDDFNERLEDDIFLDRTTLSEPGWGGFAAFIKKTGTYNGLSQTSGDSVGNQWKAQVIGGGSAGKPSTIDNSYNTTPLEYLTYMLLYTTRGKTKGKRNMVDYGLTTRNGWMTIHTAIEANRRVIVERSLLKQGHQNFTWMGVPFMWSDSCPANKIFGINSNFLELYCQTPKLLVGNQYDTNQPIGKVYQTYHKGQIVCRNPRHFAVISSSHIG